jgi:hypothetical protein
LVTSQTLAILYDRIFHLSQGLMPAVNDLLLGYLLFTSRGWWHGFFPGSHSLERRCSSFSWSGVLFGLWGQRSTLTPLAARPVAPFEFSLGVYLVAKGFRPSPITAGIAATHGPSARQQLATEG